jgi:predicted short-subunit dehydrogenase-like oxidoreductase (DUF2520 family)
MAVKRAGGVNAGNVGARDRSASHNSSRGPKGARKVTVSIVGAGRLGTALALALAAQGYTIEAVVAGTLRHARKAAALVGTDPLALPSTRLEELPSSDILFITTPDDAIAATAARLAAITDQRSSRKMKGTGKGAGQRVALHASGALSSDALRSLSEAGFATGSMHPLVSVSDSVHGAESLCSAFFCLEGSRAAIAAANRMVRTLGAQSFSINANDKALYHAAAVMASGHMTALFDIAVELLARCGLTRTRARAVLLPLLRSTLANLYTSDAARALTGTFARADTATVRRHLDALRSKGTTDALAAYRVLGERSLQLAKAAGVRSGALQEIKQALAESAKGKRE